MHGFVHGLKVCMLTLHLQEVYTSRTNFYHLLQQANRTSELGRLHQQVCKLVTEIVEQKVEPKRLIDMAKKRQVKKVKLQLM